MRLQRLKLKRYGCFDDLDLELAAEPGRITMIVAQNGAGKSVLRRAFHDLLFDIPLQSPMKFRHGYPGMALHADAIDADGTAFNFGWVRGGKPPRVTNDTLRFAALQRGVTPQQLERLFALDTAGLRKGGTDLKGGTTLAGALLAGTGELSPAKSVRALIEARRQANWGQGKSKPPLNAAASRLDAERKKSRAAVHRPEQRVREESELADRRGQHEAAKQARDDALLEARRLNRIALTRPHLQQLREAEAWLAGHPDAPALPAGLNAQLADARHFVATAQATHDGAQAALALAAQAAKGIARDDVITRLADHFDPLPGMLGEADKTAKDIVDRRGERAAKLADIRSVLRDIGAAVAEDRAGEIIPTMGLMAEARTAITREAGLRKALDLALDRSAKASAAQAEMAADPVAAPELKDGLVALLAEIRADRNPVQHATELAEANRSTRASVTRALALMPGWRGTAEALRALAIPAEEAFERLDISRQAASAHHEQAHRLRTELAAQEASTQASLALLRERPLPDEAAITTARVKRDRGMQLVLRRAFATPPTATEEEAYAAARPVAVAYQLDVRTADDLADRRAVELERVQEAERLGRSLAELANKLQQAEAAGAAANGNLRMAETAWADAIAPLGLDGAATMAELRKTLSARLQLIEAMRTAELAAGSEAALTATHLAWAEHLAALLGVPPAPLAGLLGRADEQVAAVRAAEQATARRQAAREAGERESRDAAEARSRAERDVAEWRTAWAGLLDRLHRPAGESPDAVSAVLAGLTTLDQHHRDAVALARRIGDMAADLDRFAASVAALAAAVEQPVLANPSDTARALISRSTAAAAAHNTWRQADLNQKQAENSVAQAVLALTEAKNSLRAVVAACGATTAEEAEARIAASRAHGEQAALRDAARAALTQHGDGLSVAALQSEADAILADDMPARRAELDEAAKAAAHLAETAAISLDKLSTTLAADAEATEAVDARADYEAALAEFGRRLEDQLVLNLASAMLGGAMHAIEAEMGGSSLARVSHAFAAVTGGAYGLEIRDGAEGEELHAVEHAYPDERKSLDELSEGTRDQLYLALRMVALRDHCASATALPFIADDILQTFDDDRARATLLALGELSQDLQVIVLTHHTHLGQIAAELGEGRVHLLRLQG